MTIDVVFPLETLPIGEWAEVAELYGEDSWVHRLAELGVRVGSRLRMVQGGSPCLLQIGGYRLSLRNELASQIMVRPLAADLLPS